MYNKASMIKQDRLNQISVSNGNHCPCDFKGNMYNNKDGTINIAITQLF